MKALLVAIYLLSCFLETRNVEGSSSKDKEKFDKKVKHYENLKMSASTRFSCSDFSKEIHTTVDKRLFMSNFVLVKSNFVTQYHSPLASTLSFYEKIYDLFYKQCYLEKIYTKFESNIHELTWSYQFNEAQHCIRVELNLGNATRFKQVFGYDSYMFSFREFHKKNIHLKKQDIVDEVNSLTIHRVHIRPYVICVSFFKSKKQNPIVTNETLTESNNG